MIFRWVEIPVGQGRVAWIDPDDAERVRQFNWSLDQRKNGTRYASRKDYRNGGRKVYLHRFIMEAAEDEDVDHLNGNGLDCRRSNMRLTTRTQNLQNQHKHRAKSGVRGAYWCGRRRRFYVQIWVNKKAVSVGSSPTIEGAELLSRAAHRVHHTHSEWGSELDLGFAEEVLRQAKGGAHVG